MRPHPRNLIALAALLTTPPAGAQWNLVVHGDGRELGPTPVTVLLDPALSVSPGPYTLRPPAGGDGLPTYVRSRADGRSELTAVLPAVDARGTQAYGLSSGDRKPRGVAVEPQDGRPDIAITLDGRPFTTLDLHTGPKPYLFPVIGPTGKPFTRAYPMQEVEGEDRDHPHQRSFWFTHGKVNGIDFWAEGPNSGRIVPRRGRSESQQGGSAVVVVEMNDDWLAPRGQVVCRDARTLRFYGVDSPRIIDFDITIKASEGPVTFGDTKEGMFGLRVASSMDVKRKEGGKITNAEGITDADAWGKASPWVDYTGPVDGKTVGIAILNHPDSFRYPTTWHVRDYGLFAANPFGYHDFGRPESGDYTIPQGQSITFRYRVILHEGDTETARIAAAFEAYARPPKVEVVKP